MESPQDENSFVLEAAAKIDRLCRATAFQFGVSVNPALALCLRLGELACWQPRDGGSGWNRERHDFGHQYLDAARHHKNGKRQLDSVQREPDLGRSAMFPGISFRLRLCTLRYAKPSPVTWTDLSAPFGTRTTCP